MERYTIPHNVNTACITVLTFPDGIEEAFQQLRAFFPSTEQKPRRYFGISYPQQNGKLMYKAAVELFQGECSSFENFVIEQGPYISEAVHDYMQDIPAITNTFSKLVTHPQLKEPGYCVEYYYNDKDVLCMSQLEV
jgi:hypothetical protein